ncbi:MAG: phosphoribosyltransferase family protein, partial [Pseudomonadota bacterium]
SAGEVSSSNLVAGQVDGTTVLLLDDLIASGETMVRAAKALRQAGARRVVACAAHGLFVDQAASTLLDESISQVVITDSVPPFRVPPDSVLRQKLRIVSCAAMAADALRLSHEAWAC